MIKFHPTQPVGPNPTQIQSIISQIQSDPMGGWFDLPDNYDREEFSRIQQAATQIQSDSQYLVCIGIGGSYLGHRALIDAIRPHSSTQILYAGNSLSPREFSDMLDTLGDADFSINVISKSGTTTEPAVAFRLLKEKLYQKYGDTASQRIYATTDAQSGALHNEAVKESYQRFTVPDNIGGRYSVLSAVGLLPLAVAGVDIADLMQGAADGRASVLVNPAESAAAQYATARADLQQRGFDVEVLASFEPRLRLFAEWWKQLFGESEGKQQQGIFPASVTYTTDLHSLGQYLQDGRRNIFETMLEFASDAETDYAIPQTEQDLDGLNYLAGKTMAFMNQKALEATIEAHRTGGIPVFELQTPDFSAHSFGALVYFFELACAISAKLSGVNPFDQPGVEAYKKNMFHLLGKPGY